MREGPRMSVSVDQLEGLFKALSDSTRLRILGLLTAGETCVCHIHESLRLPQPKVSRHLAYLRRAGLVQGRKDGLWVHYRVADPTDEVVAALLSSVRHCLSHVPVTSTDRRRLETRAGSGPSGGSKVVPVLTCCSGRRRSRVSAAAKL
jgi:ArsR family transcriptional regulator, arsenate/arsenite/antimonite-responsive transcriptional repressor